MLEIKYAFGKDPKTGKPYGQQRVDIGPIADGAVVSVHFKTPTLRERGKGGIVQIANDRPGATPNGRIQLSMSKTAGDMTRFKEAAPGQSASINFLNFPLDSNTDYYINLRSVGASPNPVRVKLTAGPEPRSGR